MFGELVETEFFEIIAQIIVAPHLKGRGFVVTVNFKRIFSFF